MPDYSNCKIYSIRFYDNDKLIYIGSTTQSSADRFRGHKTLITSLYQYIRDNYNCDFKCCYIELLEPYECKNRSELNKREAELIMLYKADDEYIVINKRIPNINPNHDIIAQKIEYRKQYKQNNADKIKQYAKQYYQKNVDKINQYAKQYYQEM